VILVEKRERPFLQVVDLPAGTDVGCLDQSAYLRLPSVVVAARATSTIDDVAAVWD
jgi:hypothetical protein